MNKENRKNCKNLDCAYKSCQDCKWFAGARDTLDDSGDDWVSTRGVCVAQSGDLDKQNYLPGNIIFVDADEDAKTCDKFEELNTSSWIDNSIGYQVGIAQQYPGYWKNTKELNKMTVKQLKNSDEVADTFKSFAWFCSQINDDTKLKISWVAPPVNSQDDKYDDDFHKDLTALYGNVGDVYTIKEWRERFKKFATEGESVFLPEEAVNDIYKTTPTNFMAETEVLGLSYEALMEKDGEQWWQPLGLGY